MASNTQIVRRYLDAFLAGKVDFDGVRACIAADFVFEGPMVQAQSAAAFIEKMKSYGDSMEMHGKVHHVVADGDVVSALYDLQGPSGAMSFAEWYWLEGGKIARIKLHYDPRPFLELQAG